MPQMTHMEIHDAVKQALSSAPLVSPAIARLHVSASAVFCDLRASLRDIYSSSENSVSAHRQAVTLRASRLYRRQVADAIVELDQSPQNEATGVETEGLQLVQAVWQATEVALLADSATARVQLLSWLQQNFTDSRSNDHLLASAIACLAGSRASLSSYANDVWDVAFRLTVEGRPNDAGKLLAVLAAATAEPEVATIGQLLCAFPLLGVAAEEAGAAYTTAWGSWRARAVAARASGIGRGLHPHAEGLVALMAGDVSQALSRARHTGSLIPRHLGAEGAAAATAPYNAWYLYAFAGVLYGRSCPLTMRRRAFAAHLRESMAAAGVDIAGAEAALDLAPGPSSSALQPARAAWDPGAELLAGFLAIFRGDAGWPLTALRRYGHTWASAHLCDLLWVAGLLDAPPGLLPGPWRAPARPHMLLSHALTLATPTAVVAYSGSPQDAGAPSSLWAQALAYAVAATPEAVAAETGAVYGGPAACTTAAAVAQHSGSTASAHALTHALFDSAVPLVTHSDVTAALSLARKLGLEAVACGLHARWVKACLRRDGNAGLPAALTSVSHAVSTCTHATELEGHSCCAEVRLAAGAVGSALTAALASTIDGVLNCHSQPAPHQPADVPSALSAALLGGAADAAFAGIGLAFPGGEPGLQGEGVAGSTSDDSLIAPLSAVSIAVQAAVTIRCFAGCAASVDDSGAASNGCALLQRLLQGAPPLCPPAHLLTVLHLATAAPGLLSSKAASPALLQSALQRLSECAPSARESDAPALAAVQSALSRALAQAMLRS